MYLKFVDSLNLPGKNVLHLVPKQKTLLSKRLTWFVQGVILLLGLCKYCKNIYWLQSMYLWSILLYFLFPTQQSHNNHHAGNVFRIILKHVFVTLHVGYV